jgi:hypothetical protein
VRGRPLDHDAHVVRLQADVHGLTHNEREYRHGVHEAGPESFAISLRALVQSRDPAALELHPNIKLFRIKVSKILFSLSIPITGFIESAIIHNASDCQSNLDFIFTGVMSLFSARATSTQAEAVILRTRPLSTAPLPKV